MVLGNRNLARVELVWACSCLVRWASAILISLYAYEAAGAGAVGVVALVRLIPAALFAPRLSLTADRASRRLVLLASLLARLALLAAMTGVVAVEGDLVVLVVLAASYGVADSLQTPTQAALIGVHAQDPGQLAGANTLWGVLDNAAFLVGSVLVAIVVAVSGLTEAFAVLLVPLAVGVIAALRLRKDAPLPLVGESAAREELLAGVRAIAGDRQVTLLVWVFAGGMLVQAVVDVLLVVVALGILDFGQQGAGWLNAAWGVGGVLGGMVAGLLVAHRRLAAGLILGLVVSGLPLAPMGLWPDHALALGLMVVLGVGFGVFEVAIPTLTQRLVAADVLARVYGVQETLTIVAMAVGSLVASVLVVLLGETGALVATALALPIVAVVLRGPIIRLDGGVAAPPVVFALLRAVPAFSTLPMATVETLALRANRSTVQPGHEVVRQGEPGDSFYVIEHGRVEVIEHSVTRRFETDGDFFGEIALLHDIPRSATVRAVEPTTLVLLGREDFLAAVGVHPRTRHALQATAAERLNRSGDGAQ